MLPDARHGFRTGDRVAGDCPTRLRVPGRRDEQVKIDRYRVESGEIEAVARQVEGVATAHACLIGGEPHATLAVVHDHADEADVPVDTVHRTPADRLPRYMTPTRVAHGRDP
jgi:acyl-coenzyme A synthetase/AMP-(fatty) acid ligase